MRRRREPVSIEAAVPLPERETCDMRFGNSNKAPSYLGRGYQMRLVSLVFALGLVLAAVQVARQPDFWAKLFPPEQQPAGKTVPPPTPAVPPLEPNEVRIPVAPRPSGADRPAEGAGAGKQETAGQTDVAPQTSAGGTDRRRTAEAQIAPFVLQTVKDDTVGVRADERDAYYHVLAQARDARRAELESVARPGVAYAAVMTEPGQWRGRAVTIQGTLRRLQALPVGENSYGIGRLYDAWLFTADSGLDPWRVVCCTVPEDMPLAEELKPPVEVRLTGYFFKKQGYAATHGLHTAPLVLAGRIDRVVPPVQFVFEERAFRAWMIAFGTALAALTAFLFWRFAKEDRRFARSGILKRVTQVPREEIEALNDAPLYDAGAALRQLGEEARALDATAASAIAPPASAADPAGGPAQPAPAGPAT
jgi:hypothetical protein